MALRGIMEPIGYEVEGTAQWRREKAIQFPNDTRNSEGAEELDQLAKEIRSVANMIVAQRARAHGVVIGFWEYFKVGAPLTMLSILFGIWWL